MFLDRAIGRRNQVSRIAHQEPKGRRGWRGKAGIKICINLQIKLARYLAQVLVTGGAGSSTKYTRSSTGPLGTGLFVNSWAVEEGGVGKNYYCNMTREPVAEWRNSTGKCMTGQGIRILISCNLNRERLISRDDGGGGG